MRFLLRFILKLFFLAILTFCFVVLFEHGTARFSEGAKAEWNALLFFVGSALSREETGLARPAGQASPTPASTSPPAQKAPAAGNTAITPTKFVHYKAAELKGYVDALKKGETIKFHGVHRGDHQFRDFRARRKAAVQPNSDQ